MFRSFIAVLYFLTHLPLPKRKISLEEVGRGAWAFPLVGMFIGLLLLGSNWLLSFFFPPILKAALVLVLWVAVTGALHLDGFADCCDALLTVKPPEVRLEILRDTHIGAFAVVGIAGLLLVKFASLATCLGGGGHVALLLAPPLGRWAIVYAIVCYPAARTEGMGKVIKESTDWRALAWATLSLLPLFPLNPGVTLLSLALTWIFTLLFAFWVMRRIPGFTGDVYGALCELVEALVLLSFALSK